jgi:hypothetical protein
LSSSFVEDVKKYKESRLDMFAPRLETETVKSSEKLQGWGRERQPQAVKLVRNLFALDLCCQSKD